jgi:hypothetical protein
MKLLLRKNLYVFCILSLIISLTIGNVALAQPNDGQLIEEVTFDKVSLSFDTYDSYDIAIVLRMRDGQNLGWSRMAEEYRNLSGEYVSRDTVKRRYFEANQRINNSAESPEERRH